MRTDLLSVAIFILGVTQVPAMLAHHSFNRCVSIDRGERLLRMDKWEMSHSGKVALATKRAVILCNSGKWL